MGRPWDPLSPPCRQRPALQTCPCTPTNADKPGNPVGEQRCQGTDGTPWANTGVQRYTCCKPQTHENSYTQPDTEHRQSLDNPSKKPVLYAMQTPPTCLQASIARLVRPRRVCGRSTGLRVKGQALIPSPPLTCWETLSKTRH